MEFDDVLSLSLESLYSDTLVAGGLYILCLETLECGDVYVSNEGVQLVWRVLVLISESCQTDADTIGDVSGKMDDLLILN